MNTIKRIIVVALLVVVGILVGCFAYTGNRLKAYPNDISAFKGVTFMGDTTVVSFNDENSMIYIVGKMEISLKIIEYVGGVISAKAEEKEYRFIVLDDMLYDEQTKEFLTKGARYG